ncbi:MAG: SBBP repeat-containing protein, partial [Armatimonadetes bacterium]|nr:SBBP repeat-containing protein [Armatimonadota bacterium]
MFDIGNLTDRGRDVMSARREVGRRSATRAWEGLARFACIAAGLGVMSAAFGQVQEEWVRRYDSPINGGDSADVLAVDSGGNVYVSGVSEAPGTGLDYATLKYDPNGNLLWARYYNGPGNTNDRVSDIAVDSAGNVYVTGFSRGSGTGWDYATLKYDTNGNQQWARRYNGPGNGDDRAFALVVDSAGSVYVTGQSLGSGTADDYATLKYDPNGNLLWVRRYNGPGNANDGAEGVVVDSAGDVYVVGGSTGSGTLGDFTMLKYDTDGNLLWERRYDGPGNGRDFAFALAVDSGGSVYVTGRSDGTDWDYATLKYDTNGNQLWVRRYDGPGGGRDQANALAVDSAGSVYVTGLSVGSGTARDYATMKYDTNGNLLWEMRYNGPGNETDEARALALDSAGNVYVTGDSQGGPATRQDYATIKYVQSVEALPDSFTIIRGILLSGGLPDLFDSDDSRLVVRTAVFAPSIEPPVQIEVVGTSPKETPGELRFR